MTNRESMFLKSGSNVHIRRKEDLCATPDLEPLCYVVKYNETANEYFLTLMDAFEPSPKIYGKTPAQRERIINTFISRPQSTGVLLSGEKGSGKTLLAKELSCRMAAIGYPTIIINEPYSGDTFNSFIQSITTPALVMFDEFEKVYDREEQEQMLTLLDGVFPSKKLFVLTCNDLTRTNDLIRNRPGRVFYHISYKGLEEEFIREYCLDTLLPEYHMHIDQLCSLASLFKSFNFDMLKALVEEINRYGDTPEQACEMLNTKPEDSGGVECNVKLTYKGKDITDTLYSGSKTTEVNITNPYVMLHFDCDNDVFDELGGAPVSSSILMTGADMVSFDAKTGQYVFTNSHYTATLTRRVDMMYDYWRAF